MIWTEDQTLGHQTPPKAWPEHPAKLSSCPFAPLLKATEPLAPGLGRWLPSGRTPIRDEQGRSYGMSDGILTNKIDF